MPGRVHDEVSCPLCKGGMAPLFQASDYRRPDVPDIFRVYWCAECEYGRVAPSPSPQEVPAFYDTGYYTHAQTIQNGGAYSLAERVRLHIGWRFDRGVPLETSEPGPPGPLLDIGCGDGANMERFGAAGFQVAGVEPDPEARASASRHGPVSDGTAETFELPAPASYRYLLMANSLEHVISPLETLSRIRRLLRPDGRLIIEVPNCGSLGFRSFGPLWPWTDLPRHLHFFTRSSLARALDMCGYAVTRVLHVGFARQFDREWIQEIRRIDSQARYSGTHATPATFGSWTLLMRAALASPDRKYDSIRLHARPV